jgi:hypothetical protein
MVNAAPMIVSAALIWPFSFRGHYLGSSAYAHYILIFSAQRTTQIFRQSLDTQAHYHYYPHIEQ